MMASLVEHYISQADDIEVVGKAWDAGEFMPLLPDAGADVAVLEATLLPVGEDIDRPSLASMGLVVVTTRCIKPPELGLPIERALRTLAHLAMCETARRRTG